LFANGALDTTQVPRRFSTENFWTNLNDVAYEWSHPYISLQGEPDVEIHFPGEFFGLHSLPNYMLHTLGNGMTYRIQTEWFLSRGVEKISAHALGFLLAYGMAFANEGIEKNSVLASDTIADLWFFDPLGIFLFSFEGPSLWVRDTLKPAFWHYQPVLDPFDLKARNVGLNYTFRPEPFSPAINRAITPFLQFGMMNLLGASVAVRPEHKISLGAGISMVDPNNYEYRFSGGLFWDKNNSLMASLVANGTDEYLLRFNCYPGVFSLFDQKPWWFVGVGENLGSIYMGIGFDFFPLGLGGAW
jgi:hypothetical protein